MNRVLCFVLVLLASTSLFANGNQEEAKVFERPYEFNELGTYPIVKQEGMAELNLFTGLNPNWPQPDKASFLIWLEDFTNVDVKWETVTESETSTKINLLIASDDYPEILFGRTGISTANLYKYGQQGIFLPLEDMIAKWAPNLQKILNDNPEYRARLTAPDGHIYGLPNIREEYDTSYEHFFINKNWLAKVGMEIPDTTAELEKVLIAFRDMDANGNGDPDDEIPITFENEGIGSWNKYIGLFFGSFGIIDTKSHLMVEDGKVFSTATDPRFKDALKYWSSLYKQGLVDPESLVQEQEALYAKAENNQVGIIPVYGRSESIDKDNDREAALATWDLMLIPEGPNGDRVTQMSPLAFGFPNFIITDKCSDPELAMRWVDTFYHEQYATESVSGRIGETLELRDDGLLHQIEGVNHWEHIYPFPPMALIKGAFPYEMVKDDYRERSKKLAIEAYAPYYHKEHLQTGFMSQEDAERLSIISAELNPFIDENFAKFLTGKVDIDEEWDDFQAELKDYDVEELVAIYQKYHSDFLAKIKM